MASVKELASEYFSNLNPIASKITSDIKSARKTYGDLWESFTEREKEKIINDTIIKPELVLKYASTDDFERELDDETVLSKGYLMAFFEIGARKQRQVEIGEKSVLDDDAQPFLFQTKSQLNLCGLAETRREEIANIPKSPLENNLQITHFKVVSELKTALKSHKPTTEFRDKWADTPKTESVTSPNFISKLIGNKKSYNVQGHDEKECLVSPEKHQVVASSENYFKTNFRNLTSPPTDRNSAFGSKISEERHGLLAGSSIASTESSCGDFLSCEELDFRSPATEESVAMSSSSSIGVPKTGYDFLDNW